MSSITVHRFLRRLAHPRLYFQTSLHLDRPVRASHSSTSNTSSSSVTARGPKAPPVLRSAIDDLRALPEVQQATETVDAVTRETLLSRVLAITSRSTATKEQNPNVDSGSSSPNDVSPHTAIAHLLLARHSHQIGDVAKERSHRVNALRHLTHVAADDAANVVSHHHVLSSAHAALSLACLRACGAEMRLAASAAADEAAALAVGPHARTAAALLAALAASKGRRTLLLSALAAVSPHPGEVVSNSVDETEPEGPDVAGYARYFLARDATEKIKTEGKDSVLSNDGSNMDTLDSDTALDHALALVVRWDGAGHDLSEALVQAGETCYVVRKDAGYAQAEDLLSRAVKEAGRVGTEADEAEGLLGLARLFALRGAAVEAEGLFRAAEGRLLPMWERKAFTVPAAHVFCRICDLYGHFLGGFSIDGRARTTEARVKGDMAREVRMMFPQVLPVEFNGKDAPPVPPWFVQSLIPHFDIDLPI